MKKITFLFALLCASVMGWADTEYCGYEITGTTHGHKMSVTYQSLGSNQYTLIMTSTDDIVSYNAGSNFYTEVNGVGGTNVSANLTQSGNTLTFTTTSNPKPNVYVGDFYVNYSDGEEHYNIPTDEDWTATCGGGGSTPAPGEKFVAANASISSTYFATGDGWTADTESGAEYNSTTGVISVNLVPARNLQWQAQVKLALGFSYAADKYYDFSIKFHANQAVGGVTLKTSNDNALFYEDQSVNLPADADFVFTKSDVAGVAGDNTFVFDFGHAPANTNITISEISIIEKDEPSTPPTPVDPNDYTAGGHTIHLDASYVGDIYTLVITSADDMEGLGGSFWNVNGASTDMRSNSGTNSYTVSGDKKTITCQVQSTSAPNIHTPLYVLMPGEVNFGNVTLNWENRGPINSEYCNYQGPETQQDNHYYAITWETDPSGNVVITIGNGTGAGACSFRNGGFEGGNNGLANFVVSDDNFATTTPATDYFTVTRPSDGDLEYVMTKVADLPANAKIKHLSAGAIAWKEAGVDRWCWPEFTYTYGGTCNQLDAPTNVAIDADSIITFDAVTGADKYTAYIALGGVEKYQQEVTSGDKLHFIPYVDGAYDVTIVASGAGKVDSDPSTTFVWNLEAIQIVLGNSEYCEHMFGSGNQQAALTWETDGDGNIVITISDVIDGTQDPAHFRGNGMAIGNFEVGAGKTAASNYFNHACSGNHVTLSLKNPANAPALGEKIYFNNHVVEYTTKQNTNAYGDYTFEYTYGTVCTGKSVSATPNNNTMGTAVVQKAGIDVTSVDEGDEVSFIATVADAELYRFVNWTKGGVEVSTNATYVTTITETTNLIANFDYIRNTYCHAEINSIQNKKLYLTLGAIGGGKYQIKIEGSAEAQLTSLANANYTINWVSTDIAYEEQKMSGQDVPFTKENGRWSFDAAGYGSATAVFGISEGNTWEDIHVWNHAIYFMTDEGEVGYTDFPGRYHIAWNETCTDTEAPSFDKAEAEVLNESSVRLKIQASDNWEGMLQYTIARADAEPIISNHASGEEFTQDVTGLTTGTEYDFTVTVGDGVNNASTHILVTPVGDETKPVMGAASLDSKTWHSAIINVAATDDKGVVAYYIVELNDEFVPAEGKITVDGLTEATAYTFTIKAKDAAGNTSNNYAEVSFTTYAHALAPTTAAPVPTWPAEQVKSLYSNTYAFAPASLNSYNEGWWAAPAMTEGNVGGNTYLHYNLAADGMIGWQFAQTSIAIMEKLHIDIFSSGSGTVTIRPITKGDPDEVNNVRKTLTLVGQQWNSFDISLSEFPGHDWTKLFQFSIEYWNAGGLTGEHISVDNVYFYRTTPYVDNVDPTAFTASLAAEHTYSVQINAQASDNSGAVIFTVKNGDVVVATQNAVSGAATIIDVTGLNAGTAYNFNVYVADEAGNALDPIAIPATTKALPAAAPTPKVYDKTVVPVFSDAIAGGPANIGLPYWGQVSASSFINFAADDKVFFARNFNFQGWDGFHINATGMEYLHVDVFTRDIASINITPISEGHEGVYNVALTANEWTSVDIPLSVYDANNINWADIFQFKFFDANPVGKDIFIDNVYFYKFREPDYTRAVTEGKYGTICLPKAGVMTGAMIFEVAYLDNSVKKIFFDEVISGEMIAGRPYIFLPNESVDELGVFYTDDAEVSAGNYRGLFGSYTQEVLSTDGTNYILLNNQYCHVVNPNTSVGANRAYFKIGVEGGVPTNAVAPMPGRRRVGLTEQNTEVVTNIDNLSAGDQPVKVMIDGQLYILRGEKMYNANGQIVK